MGARIYQISQNASKRVWIEAFPSSLAPFWYQCLGDLLIRVLSWSLFSERGAGELSAGNTRICSRANKNNNRKGGRIQGGVEAEANMEGPLYPEWHCVSGLLMMTLSWVGFPTTAPVRVSEDEMDRQHH